MTDNATYLRGNEFRINVLAPSIADVIQCAGGWIYDRVRMGWAVRVGVPDPRDGRLLRILGADTVDLESMLAGTDDESTPSGLAVGLALCTREARVGTLLHSALADRRQVTTWGTRRPADVDDRLVLTDHRLSAAARAFKAHALNAASLDPIATDTETLFSSGAACTPHRPGSRDPFH